MNISDSFLHCFCNLKLTKVLALLIAVLIPSPASCATRKNLGLPIKIIQLNTILEQFKECAIVIRVHLDLMNIELEPFDFPFQYSNTNSKINRGHSATSIKRHLTYYRKRVYCSVNVYFGVDKKSRPFFTYPSRKTKVDFPFEYPSYAFIFLSEVYSRNALTHLQPLVKKSREFISYLFTIKEQKFSKHFIPASVVKLVFICQFCVVRSPKEMHKLLTIMCPRSTNFAKCKDEMIGQGKLGLRDALWDQRPVYNCSTHIFTRRFQHPPNDYEYFVKTIPCLLQLNQSVLSHNWNSDIRINFKPSSLATYNQIPVDTISFSFITCDGVKYPDLSLLVFKDPFDKWVWIGIIAMLCFTVGAIVYMNINESSLEHVKLIIPLYLNLIEQGISSNSEIYLNKIKLGNYMFGLWILSGIILTNAYKGIIVSLLALPPQPFLEVAELEDLENYTFFSSITKLAESSPSREAKSCLPDPRFRITLCNSKYRFAEASELGKILDIYRKNNIKESKQKAAEKIYDNMILYFESNVTIFLQKMSSCNKSAFGHNTKILPKFLSYFRQNNPNKKYTFFQGKKEFGTFLMSWTTTEFPVSVPYERLSALYFSGIMKYWEYWRLWHQYNRTETHDLEEQVLSVENLHIQTIFYIFLASNLISAVVFIGELLISIFQRIDLKIKLLPKQRL